MYSGTILRDKSGRIMGGHQKIDRVARHNIAPLLDEKLPFPSIRDILHFEGLNGPDGIKKKSPARDELWHFVDPHNPDDRAIVDIFENGIKNLAAALVEKNHVRAAFEAAWLAHGVVDGLTPAHHYPLEEKLEELRGGEGIETRTTVLKKAVMPGKTSKDKIKNNWEYWGAKGVMTTHFLFEAGVASTIKPLQFEGVVLKDTDIGRLKASGFGTLFEEAMQEVVALQMYEEFKKTGWTKSLAAITRRQLVPIIIRTVMLSWYEAYLRALELSSEA